MVHLYNAEEEPYVEISIVGDLYYATFEYYKGKMHVEQLPLNNLRTFKSTLFHKTAF